MSESKSAERLTAATALDTAAPADFDVVVKQEVSYLIRNVKFKF